MGGDGDDVAIEEPDCFDPLSLDVAVIAGDYDDFQMVLSNMGFGNYYLVDGLLASDIQDFLLDPESMSAYDIIFFNGGHIEEDVIYDLDGSQSEELEEGDRDPRSDHGQHRQLCSGWWCHLCFRLGLRRG